MKKISAAFLTTFLFASVAIASPVGQYSVEGTSPGEGGKYSGDVKVEKTGDTYRVTWIIGDTTFIGTGIGDDKFIAVSYKSDNDKTGLALYGAAGDNWGGVWTYSGGKKIGTEVWTRK